MPATLIQPLWEQEFPDYDDPTSITELISHGWTDVSWRNDACPCVFRHGWYLYVDYISADIQTDPPFRFSIHDENGDCFGRFASLDAFLATKHLW
jgi:hypothetical protein